MFEWQRSLFDQAANKSCGGALSNDSPRRLGFPAPRREDVFGIAVRLLASLEDQIASCLESYAVEAGRHGMVQRVALVLCIHHGSHPLQRFHDLLPGDDALMQP